MIFWRLRSFREGSRNWRGSSRFSREDSRGEWETSQAWWEISHQNRDASLCYRESSRRLREISQRHRETSRDIGAPSHTNRERSRRQREGYGAISRARCARSGRAAARRGDRRRIGGAAGRTGAWRRMKAGGQGRSPVWVGARPGNARDSARRLVRCQWEYDTAPSRSGSVRLVCISGSTSDLRPPRFCVSARDHPLHRGQRLRPQPSRSKSATPGLPAEYSLLGAPAIRRS
jgi:hypothetical protein